MGRDGINTYWEVMGTLLENFSISDSEEQWFMELWDED